MILESRERFEPDDPRKVLALLDGVQSVPAPPGLIPHLHASDCHVCRYAYARTHVGP